jgi:ABC-type microcin C transport system duplicated ATPase subunit YejF
MTQRPSILKNATRVAVLEKGQIVESDAPSTLLSINNSIYRKMLITELKNTLLIDTNDECEDLLSECLP